MKVNIEQGTDDWLIWRRCHVCASDMPVIMDKVPPHWGLNSWLKLWKDKRGEFENVETPAMRRGTNLEDEARKLASAALKVELRPQVEESDLVTWAGASLDGISKDGRVLVEIKVPGVETHEAARRGHIPEHYMYQMQWQLFVTGLQDMWYCSYDGSNLAMLPVTRDEALIEKMFDRAADFWGHVLREEEPPLSDRDYKQQTGLEWHAAAKRWIDAQARVKEMEAKEREARDHLIRLAGDQSSTGSGVKLTRYMAKGSVDYAAVPELKGVDLEPYRKASAARWRIMEKD